MKSKNLLTLFACFVLIITTFINVSIHKKQSTVLGQTTSLCQRIGGYCTNNCTQTSFLRCLSGKWLGCSTTYCARSSSTYPTPVPSRTLVPTKTYPIPTIGSTMYYPTPTTYKPSLVPTRPPTTYIPTPTNVGSTYPSLGYIPCYEIQRVYTQFCQSTYPTFTPTPSPRLLTMTPVPSSTRYPTNTPTRSPTSTPRPTSLPTIYPPTKTPTPRLY